MQKYFANEEDSNFIARDYEIMADLYSTTGAKDSALTYYIKAVEMEKDTATMYGYYKRLALLSSQLKNYVAQANWLQKYYEGNTRATNVDLFNWGLANYRADKFKMADSVFGMYVAKYPEQSFGYYWQARSNLALDKTMEDGLAVPYYQKLIEVLKIDSTNSNYKNWMIEAYGYLAAYEANTLKHYTEAISYFEKILELDPENKDAKRYVSLLQKNATPDGTK